MRTFDLAPLFRSSVGFERLFDRLDQAAGVEAMASWPPYSVEKAGENHDRIFIAVAGFAPDEIDLVQHDTSLLVTGQRKESEGERAYLHRGIAARSVRQTFSLADQVTVTDARLENGLLCIDLARDVPEVLKPRRIAIGIAHDNAPTRLADRAKPEAIAA